jgi:hypothetical protein
MNGKRKVRTPVHELRTNLMTAVKHIQGALEQLDLRSAFFDTWYCLGRFNRGRGLHIREPEIESNLLRAFDAHRRRDLEEARRSLEQALALLELESDDSRSRA